MDIMFHEDYKQYIFFYRNRQQPEHYIVWEKTEASAETLLQQFRREGKWNVPDMAIPKIDAEIALKLPYNSRLLDYIRSKADHKIEDSFMGSLGWYIYTDLQQVEKWAEEFEQQPQESPTVRLKTVQSTLF
ncbi:MAG: hypothetical protein ABR502_12475 [Chitinophagaceae bacterium]